MVVAVRLCSAPGATWAGLSRFTKVVERHLDLGIRCHTVATVRAVGNVKMASGVPVHQDVSGIIDPVAGSLRSDGRCLPIIHLIEDDPASDRELFMPAPPRSSAGRHPYPCIPSAHLRGCASGSGMPYSRHAELCSNTGSVRGVRSRSP